MATTELRGSMPSAAAPKETCTHCNGRIELVGQGSGRPKVRRCATCGRSPDPSATNGKADPSPAPRVFVDVAPGSAPRPCRVEHCPGKLDAGGNCACCAKRAAWIAEHMPKKCCEICGGEIDARFGRKLCVLCKPLKAKAQTADAKKKK